MIIGLGLTGGLGVASLVVAAKGLLRFPENQAAGRTNGRAATPHVANDDVTEYFLVGSFTSGSSRSGRWPWLPEATTSETRRLRRE